MLVLFEVVLISCFSEGYVLLTMLAGFVYISVLYIEVLKHFLEDGNSPYR